MWKEYFSIPNLMGYFRILMIPVFLGAYYNAETTADYLIAFAILAVSLLTDFFDGKIARKFNMITNFGKMLDPVADKLTQGALALAVTFKYPIMKILLAFFICKELYMGIMGLYLLKKKDYHYGAQWYGKICTAVMDVGIFIMLLFPQLDYRIVFVLFVIMMGLMLLSLVKYIQFHVAVIRGTDMLKKQGAPGT